ncbi:hypothetical protein AVEN_133794-1 [Araneus ventricosus]|uniref:Uncharacterized protein n=1 Tax=Araneus ventricosus TaxID=182803 RepID=A0A4Y2L3V3_ARAVE|nr:hypothetical protein AVEN_133794-1 [Araneus ventricosus]
MENIDVMGPAEPLKIIHLEQDNNIYVLCGMKQPYPGAMPLISILNQNCKTLHPIFSRTSISNIIDTYKTLNFSSSLKQQFFKVLLKEVLWDELHYIIKREVESEIVAGRAMFLIISGQDRLTTLRLFIITETLLSLYLSIFSY